MHVLYDHQIFEAQAVGGISRYFSELIPAVAATGTTSVSVFMGLHRNRYGLADRRQAFTRFFGVPCPGPPSTRGATRWLNQRLFRLFAARVRADIHHATYYATIPTGRQERRVITVHDMIHETLPQYFRAGDDTTATKLTAVDRAHHIIAVSHSTKSALLRILRVPERKVSVVYHGSALTHHVPPRPRVAAPYLLFVGERRGYKNFGALLRAYARSPRLRRDLLLVCFGGTPFTRDEQAAFASLGVADRIVRLTGDDRRLAGYYRHAAAFVQPSLAEGFGLSILEAQHYGCPVVCSRVDALAEVAGGAAAYFDPADPDDIMARLETVLFDGVEADRLRTLGYQRERQFSWQRCAEETRAVYASIL